MRGLIYGRISQRYGETQASLDNQHKACATAAAALGVPIDQADCYREQDSGHETADTRAELAKVRDKVRSGAYSHLFIHNFDRLSRTPEELVTLWKECSSRGLKVVCCLWPQFHDLDIDLAKMVLRMVGMVGEFEWSFIRQRTTQNKQRIRDSGQLVGEGGPRFGFTWDRKNRSRVPSEEPHPVFGVSSAHIVRTIFNLIIILGSLRKTARELNARGWPTPAVFRGKRYKDGRKPLWTNDSVRLVVVDETYKGVATAGRTEMIGKRKSKKLPRSEWQELSDGRTTPLVDPELWERANRQIRENDIVGRRTRAKRSAAETRNESNFALFRGLIYCGECGKPLRPVWSKGWNKEAKDYSGARVRLYRCDSRKESAEKGLAERCHGQAVYEGKVKEAVWGQLVKVATDEGLILQEAERLKRERPGEQLHRASLDAAREEIETADRRIRNLTASLAETDDKEERGLIREEIARQKTARDGHRRQVERLTAQLAVYEALDRRAEQMVERCRQLRADSPELLSIQDTEKRHWLDWLGVTLVGNGTRLKVRLDMGLEGAAGADGPLSDRRGDCPTSSQTLQRTFAEFPV